MVFPPLFLERLGVLYPNCEHYNSVINSFRTKDTLAIRINTLKTKLEAIVRFLKDAHIPVSKVPWYEPALLLQNTAKKDLTALSIYKEGKIYIQSLSSMIPALVLNPDKNVKILDMAGAPGSKTTQIAMMMNNEGECQV